MWIHVITPMPTDRSSSRGDSASGSAAGRAAAPVAVTRFASRERGAPALYLETHGVRGPLLVFLHGVGGTTRYWGGRVGPLLDSHRALLVDLLGFGRSPKPWSRYTVERHVAALHGVLADREVMTLVGHSFGATVATAYAARHPDRVAALVLVGLPHFGSEARARDYFRRDGSWNGWLMTNVVLAAVTCVVTRRLLRRVLPRLLSDLPRDVVEDLVEHTWRSSTSTMWEGVYRHDVADDVARLPSELPVLFIHGDEDRTAPLAGVATLAALRPRSTLRVLHGGDHHLLLRRPQWVLEAIRSFAAVYGS